MAVWVFGIDKRMDLIEKPAEFKELLSKIEAASTKKALLMEARLEHDLNEIIRKKGW